MNIPGIPNIATFKAAVAALAIGLLAGGIGGWIVKDKFFKAEVVEQTQKVIKDDAKTVTDAQKKDEKLQRENLLLRQEVDSLKAKLTAAIPPTPLNTVPEDSHANCPDLTRHMRLSAYAVGVLNRALSPSAPDPDAWSDEEKRALEAAGLRELSEKIREVAGQYRELAKNHDRLVDDVTEYQKKVEKYRQQSIFQ